MKSNLKLWTIVLTTGIFFTSCSSDDDSMAKDEEKPEITINYDRGFPQACTELVKGETYNFRARITDNMALASYSLDIHHNFDHHTHDDQGAQCDLEPVKEAVNPMLYMENFSLADGPVSYEIDIPITISENVDTGDYHCMFSVTDQTGWQSRTSVDIKIIE